LKNEIYQSIRFELLNLGYVEIGLDHFALENSPLELSFRNKNLKRSFMGYTEKKSNTLIGLGTSSISENQDYYWQNQKELKDYHKFILQKHLAFERGHRLSPQDQQTKKLINDMFCNLSFKINDLGKQKDDLKFFEENDFIKNIKHEYVITDHGRKYIRNLAVLFDEYFED